MIEKFSGKLSKYLLILRQIYIACDRIREKPSLVLNEERRGKKTKGR